MASAFGFLSYLRIPVAATSAIAASLSGLLYWKQKCALPQPSISHMLM